MEKSIKETLTAEISKKISSRTIVDLMNVIGKTTNDMNGNRIAEIALG